MILKCARMLQTLRAMDTRAELGAKILVLWGDREGGESDACRLEFGKIGLNNQPQGKIRSPRGVAKAGKPTFWR
jgi:hypothetical protein